MYMYVYWKRWLHGYRGRYNPYLTGKSGVTNPETIGGFPCYDGYASLRVALTVFLDA